MPWSLKHTVHACAESVQAVLELVTYSTVGKFSLLVCAHLAQVNVYVRNDYVWQNK